MKKRLNTRKMGNSLIKNTFDILSHSLRNAINDIGVEKAVSYCQTNAYPLTETYAVDSILIRRTALKYRNPANKPDTNEERILNFFVACRTKRKGSCK